MVQSSDYKNCLDHIAATLPLSCMFAMSSNLHSTRGVAYRVAAQIFPWVALGAICAPLELVLAHVVAPQKQHVPRRTDIYRAIRKHPVKTPLQIMISGPLQEEALFRYIPIIMLANHSPGDTWTLPTMAWATASSLACAAAHFSSTSPLTLRTAMGQKFTYHFMGGILYSGVIGTFGFTAAVGMHMGCNILAMVLMRPWIGRCLNRKYNYKQWSDISFGRVLFRR